MFVAAPWQGDITIKLIFCGNKQKEKKKLAAMASHVARNTAVILRFNFRAYEKCASFGRTLWRLLHKLPENQPDDVKTDGVDSTETG